MAHAWVIAALELPQNQTLSIEDTTATGVPKNGQTGVAIRGYLGG